MDPHASPSAIFIATQFLNRYYKVLATMPHMLERFYMEQSTLSISIADATGTTQADQAVGLNNIGAKVMSTIQGVEAVTSFIDAQHSANGGVMILVEGTMKKQGGNYKFTQSFFLAPQEAPQGFYVYTDILRVTTALASPAFPQTRSSMSVVPAAVYSNGNAVAAATPVLAAPAVIAAAPVAKAPAVAPVEQQQPAKALTVAPNAAENAKQQPVSLPVATAATAKVEASSQNLTYAQRLKLSSSATPGNSPAPAAHTEATEHRHERAASQHTSVADANGHPAPQRQRASSTPVPEVYGIYFRLSQDAAVTPEMVEEEFAKYGALLNGKSGVTISVHKFGGNKNVHVKYENAAGMEAALAANVTMGGKKLMISRLRQDPASDRGARGERDGRGGDRGGHRGGDRGGRGGERSSGAGGGGGGDLSFGSYRGGDRNGGRGGDRGGGRGDRRDGGERQDRPPRSDRPDRGDRPPSGAPSGATGGSGERRGGSGGGGRRGPRSGSGTRKEEAPASGA